MYKNCSTYPESHAEPFAEDRAQTSPPAYAHVSIHMATSIARLNFTRLSDRIFWQVLSWEAWVHTLCLLICPRAKN